MGKRINNRGKIGLLWLVILMILTGCQTTQPPEKTIEEEPKALELMDFINKPLTAIKPHLGDIVSIETDEMDGNPVVIYDNLRVRYYSKEEKIVGFDLNRAWLKEDNAFSVAGVTFKMSNLEVLDLLGKPVNGNRQELTYSEDYLLWWKFTFDQQDQLEHIHVFYGRDQGNRTFVDWRKS